MKRKLVWAAALCGGLLLARAAQAEGPLWVRPPATAEIAWRGMLPTEGEAVGMGVQIGPYPAFGAVGLLAAILTHAAISKGVQSSQMQKLQEDADRVLENYRTVLKAWPAQALWDAALAGAAPEQSLKPWGADSPAGDPTAEAAPVFTLAQDEGVLVLDLAVKLQRPGASAALETVVRVVSSPHAAADARAHWLDNDAQRLKAAAASMMAHALAVARDHAAAPAPDTPARTHRYLQGSIERSERAQQLAGHCARAVLRTLRGGLMSVPLKPSEGGGCTQTTPF